MKRSLPFIPVGAVGLVGVLLFFWLFVFPYMTVRSPLAYSFLRRQWQPKTIAHFPRPVPEGARAIGFYFNAGALQAATEMELRLRFEPHRRSIAKSRD
ncbi:MAG: hypothetical protein GTN81_13920 [Proteobacteria bacterium]|nr:hypothetical protein [Pseudomonadota bacterium]